MSNMNAHLNASHRAAGKAERAKNVILSARNKVFNSAIARLGRPAQERDTREHIRLVKNRRVHEELEEELNEAHRSTSENRTPSYILPRRLSERFIGTLATAVACWLHENAPRAPSEEEAKRFHSHVIDRLRVKLPKTCVLIMERQQLGMGAPKVAPCCRTAMKAAIKDVEGFGMQQRGAA
jgi:hypothetical protein